MSPRHDMPEPTQLRRNGVFQRFLMVALLAFFSAATIAPASARPAPEGFADLAERLLPSVVNISTTQEVGSPFGETGEDGEQQQLPPGIPDFFRDFFENRRIPPQEAHAMGSGFIIDPSGVIITNNHVVDGANKVVVILNDGTELDAEVLGQDRRTDIALLKVSSPKPLPAVQFGDSDKLRVGEWVIAVGNPFGLGGTVTAGIVSAIDRDINAGPYDDFIQTDAAINQGNSGGPLFDMDGNVVGVNSVIISRTGGNVGIGFSIPSRLVQRVITDLRKYGQVQRGWLGVGIQQVDQAIADSLGLKEAKGAMITNVVEGDPAEKAGIKSGDVILQFDGKEIADTRALLRAVADTPAGQKTPVIVWRDGARKTLSVEVGQMQPDDEKPAAGTEKAEQPATPAGSSVDVLGMTLAAIDDAARKELQLPEKATGVVVAKVDRVSEAAQKGIKRGDIIARIGDRDVKTLAEAKAAVAAEKKSGKATTLLRVRRGDNFLFIALKAKEEKK
ncbi:DegQ family serine endoprotease [Iodidimonas sp. SYSU 1G8]|uniref:DegQ family serine endoprotease n=1 Tax=Iodidimonas sp. SYSU 1G8 TaxID=3133967 RepID=UPI0031FEF201